jgi:hypothetical protein
MPGLWRRTALLTVVFALGCNAPLAFRLVGIDEAQQLMGRSDTALVEVYESRRPPLRAIPGGVRWRVLPETVLEPPELPDGTVLVVAAERGLGYRAAAALARTRNHDVFVLITDSAEERGTLYALDPPTEEIPRGRDS